MWLPTVLQGSIQFVYNAFQYNKRSFHRDDTLACIFRLAGEDGLPETFEDKDEGDLEDSLSECGTFHMDGSLPIKGPSERYGIFSKLHNSSVGHFGITRPLEAMTKAGHGWMGMRKDVTDWINECGVCQKIKYHRDPNWEDEVAYHLFDFGPICSLSLDTLGPLPQDKLGNKYIIIMDNFSKLVGLYLSKHNGQKVCRILTPMDQYFRGTCGNQNRWWLSIY
jgi:Integrase zinc binding domain